MKWMIFILILLLLTTACTKVSVGDNNVVEETEEDPDINYETPNAVIREIEKQTEIEDFGEVI